MAGDTQVIADGVDQDAPRQPSASPWLVAGLAAIFAAGFGVVSIVAINSTTEPEGPAVSVLDGPDIGEPATQFGVSEIIEGFGGAIVGVVVADDAQQDPSTLDYVLWPPTGTLVTRPMFSGAEVRFDFDGQHIAVASPANEGEGLELSVGRSNSIRPVISSVTSFAWHDGVSGTLAYTTEVDGIWSLWRLRPNLVSTLVETESVPGGKIVAWGEWGFAIQSPGDEVVLLTPEGKFKSAHGGIGFTSLSEGWIVVANENLDLVSSGGGVVRLDVAPDRVGDLRTAVFSPDGESIAMAGSNGLLVFPVRGEGEIREFAIRDISSLTWSQDNRFLVIPAEKGVSVLDLQTVNRYSILENYAFVAVDVVAASSS